METRNLNNVETKVLNECIRVANQYDENGGLCYNEIDKESIGITLNQLKGYLSQLVTKGYIIPLEDSYFDFELVKK